MNFSVLKNFMEHLTSWRIPGNTISVCINNREVFNYQSGYSNLEERIPMEGNELLYIYSCSKVATVIAALQLVEKGQLSLDAPLYEYISEFKEMYIQGKEGELKKAEKPITIWNLFTMTSGLAYNTDTPAFDKAREITKGKMNTLDVIRCIAEEPLSFEPGECWQYSLSHDVLAGVVEIVSGKKFSKYMEENIFNPLGMKDSFYHNDLRKNEIAEQYEFVDSDETDLVARQIKSNTDSEGFIKNAGKSNRLIFGSEYDSGGAGIITSVSDYSRFVSALANGGVSANKERILMPETIEKLRTNQLSAKQMETLNWQQLKGYGYGLGVRTLIDKEKSGSTGNIGEFGWGGAAGATVLVDPSINLSVFYTHHMLNPQEEYYQPRLRNAVYDSLKG